MIDNEVIHSDKMVFVGLYENDIAIEITAEYPNEDDAYTAAKMLEIAVDKINRRTCVFGSVSSGIVTIKGEYLEIHGIMTDITSNGILQKVVEQIKAIKGV